MLLRITKLEGETMVHALFVCCLQEEFRIKVVTTEAHFFVALRVAKTITAIVKIFHQPTAIFSAIAHKSVSLTGGKATERGIKPCGKLLRNWRRH